MRVHRVLIVCGLLAIGPVLFRVSVWTTGSDKYIKITRKQSNKSFVPRATNHSRHSHKATNETWTSQVPSTFNHSQENHETTSATWNKNQQDRPTLSNITSNNSLSVVLISNSHKTMKTRARNRKSPRLENFPLRRPKQRNQLGYEPIKDENRLYWPLIPPNHYQHMVRAFDSWSYNYSWCQLKESFLDVTAVGRHKKKPPRDGLLFVKLPKAASSTLSGIILRIAHHVGHRLYTTPNSTDITTASTKCRTSEHHIKSQKLNSRNVSQSFLVGNIRDVASRELSHIYFHFGPSQRFPARARHGGISAEEVYKQLRSGPHLEWFNQASIDLGFQLGYLNMRGILETSKRTNHSTEESRNQERQRSLQTQLKRDLAWVQYRANQVMDDYDFIFVSERMDESLIILQFLLDLDPHDLLYLSSKTAGSYRRGGGVCHEIVKPTKVPTKVHDYLSSREWFAKNYGDYLLYKTVNASLDATIENIGKDKFDEALMNFRSLLHRAQDQCSDSAIFPCSKNGTEQYELSLNNCYENDWGCGYPCLDRIK